MFYAPFVTNADVAGMPGQTAFIDRPGPHGMFIVLAGQKEREALALENADLVKAVEEAIGLRTSSSEKH